LVFNLRRISCQSHILHNPYHSQAPKNGYAYIYISNESQEPVYFGNLRVVHERGRITEENHYYAYGLKIAGISSTKAGDVNEGELKNRRQYQGAFSEYDEDIQWNDFALRNYDPQIARWVQQDPYQQFASP
jgi:RHS repeat-associated protein